jgi:hypothetical protein
MSKIGVYIQLWSYLRHQGFRTIDLIEKENKWEYHVTPHEFCIRDTFYHITRSIFEDAGNLVSRNSELYRPLDDPYEDLNRCINRMIDIIRQFNDDDLGKEIKFQWGEQTTVAEAIHQRIFHAAGHFSQLRNWVGISKRNEQHF